jgi:DNA-binding MarR family transcriptional regulator
MTVTATDRATQAAEPASTTAQLGDDARRAWRSVQEILLHGEGQNRFARACSRHDLAPSSVKALLRLSGSKPTAMRELAAAFACDASYITAVVDALEQRGLATREPHPTDRRVRTVVLTERGREVSAGVLEDLSEPPAALDALSEHEQRQLAG